MLKKCDDLSVISEWIVKYRMDYKNPWFGSKVAVVKPQGYSTMLAINM